MKNKGKVLALDYGAKRVGLAISDPSRQLFFVRPYILNSGRDDLIDKIAKFCHKEDVAELVVGLPYHADGSSTKQTAINEQFFTALKTHLSIPVMSFDESFSTFEAEHLAEEAQLKGEEWNDVKDSFSALVILKKYLGV